MKKQFLLVFLFGTLLGLGWLMERKPVVVESATDNALWAHPFREID
jgi:hypothetical protein